MKIHQFASSFLAMTALLAGSVSAAVTNEEAAKLKKELTPFGAERAGNKDGSIPAWEPYEASQYAGFTNGGKRPDPYASEKPILTITAENMEKYDSRLSDGTKAMLKKYPKTYRLDVYPTHRPASAPAWVYENTFRNATKAKLVSGSAGLEPQGAYGGVPFPVPTSGAEVIWNHLLRWRGESWQFKQNGYLITADGKRVLTVDSTGDQQMPYYFKDKSGDKFDGDYWLIRMMNAGPAIRAGEGIVGRLNLNDDKTQSWVYLTGQRRVRKLPNPCCDTPTPATAGVMSFDEVEVFTGRVDRFDWKLVGKKEIYIPYNSNRSLTPKTDEEVIGEHHLNPNAVRWELHRVWVVDASLAQGKRHAAQKSRYYIDEDSWIGVLGDRWDAQGQLWKTVWQIPALMPDVPGEVGQNFGFYDLISNTWYAGITQNSKAQQWKVMPRYDSTVFTPDGMIAEGVR